MQGTHVRSIDHVEVFVPDRHEAARWYEAALGLGIVAELEGWATDGGPLMVSGDDGRTMLALFEGEPRGSRETASGRLMDHEKAYSVYFCDPWGNRYELTTYGRDEIAARLGAS